MSIEIKYWGAMMDLTGKQTEKIDAKTLSELLEYIKNEYGKVGFKTAKSMLIAVNGTNIQLLERFKTPLTDGDKVVFLPLSGGG